MGVPETPLLGGEILVKSWGDHILDADKSSARVGGVVEETLADIIIDMSAVVVCLDGPTEVICVDVEGVKMSAYAFQWTKVLCFC